MSEVYTRPVLPTALERPYSVHYKDHSHLARESTYTGTLSNYHGSHQYESTGLKRTHQQTAMGDSNQRNAYDGPAPRREEFPPRAENPQRNEQLPSLSSLFGNPSQQSTLVPRASYPERSPTFPAVSPQETRAMSTSSYQDRPFELHHRQAPAEAQYSYSARPETADRPGLPPPPRPMQHGVPSVAGSPRPYDPRNSPYESNRTHPSPSSRWSPRSDTANRPEYFTQPPRESSFRPQELPHHQSLTQSLQSESRPFYRDPTTQAANPSTPQYPLTPASTSVAESTTMKDSLGPKIWTGTQFLPRFVGQQEVPGEGMCYFYDDGTHCKTIIDGEPVNAHWGVTKAGKPRKRLAIACITCREKKIKCDPDFPRCIQCEKFGRVCKFKNA
jgi:hypothetical protein